MAEEPICEALGQGDIQRCRQRCSAEEQMRGRRWCKGAEEGQGVQIVGKGVVQISGRGTAEMQMRSKVQG